MQDHYQKEKEAIDKSQNKLQNKSSKDILRPGVNTSGAYNTSMPTKKSAFFIFILNNIHGKRRSKYWFK